MRTYPTYQADGKTLSPKILRAIEHFLDSRDLEKAGPLAGFKPGEIAEIWKRPEVEAEVNRRVDIEDQAYAEIRGRARKLSVDQLDTKLIEILDGKAESTVTARVRALEIGYKRFGALIEKRENTGAGGEPMAFQIVRVGQKKT